VLQAVFALVLDIWEIVALADSTGRRKRLSAVHLAVSELVAAAACFLWVFLAPFTANIKVPGCNMDAPMQDCVTHYGVLRRAYDGFLLTYRLSWGLGYV
jgi:hypothetical protein